MKTYDDLHFLPFDLCKKIHILGYTDESLFVYRYKTNDESTAELLTMGSPKKNINLKTYSTVAALTYEEANEWIRDKFKLHISVVPDEWNVDEQIMLWKYKIYLTAPAEDCEESYVFLDTYLKYSTHNKGYKDYYSTFNFAINLILTFYLPK